MKDVIDVFPRSTDTRYGLDGKSRWREIFSGLAQR